MGKFTFKRNKPSGSFSSFEKESHSIKVKGKIIGMIYEKSSVRWQVSLRVEDETQENCDWSWVRLKGIYGSSDIARKFLNDNFDLINERFKLSPE